MVKKKGSTDLGTIVVIVVVVILCALPAVGYIKNIVKLCQCDFASPVKAEVIRGIGVVVPPVGVVTGFLTINDEPTVQKVEIVP